MRICFGQLRSRKRDLGARVIEATRRRATALQAEGGDNAAGNE